jgi:polyhydroxyalkanoate synthesis regulator phasin
MPEDQAQTILSPVQADNSVKAGAWQAFKDSANERELGAKLQGINLPDKVKADLWEAKRGTGVRSPEQQAVSQLPNAAGQAKQQVISNIKPVIPGTATIDPTGGGMATAQAGQNPAYNDYMHQSGVLAGTVAGPMAMGGLSQGPGIVKLLGRAAATGVGAGAGTLAGGGTPKEAAVNATTGAVSQPIAEGISSGASSLVKWMTASKTTGARMLAQASAKAGNAPVELSHATNEIVDEIVKQGKLGGTIPKVVTDLLDRVGPSTRQAAEAAPNPLTYDEARILQSNTSQMSAAEQMALKGRLQYLIPQLARSLGEDVQAAASKAGIGTEHAIGMQEYAAASARNRMLAKVGKATAKVAGAGTAYELLRKAAGK